MKRLLFLLLLIPLCVEAKIPDAEDIAKQTLNPASPFYYPNLMMRYQSGDNTLTNDDYHYLYYGYAHQDSYKPLEPNPALDRLLLTAATMDADHPDRQIMERIISTATETLKRDPFSPKVLNLLAYAYGALGNKEKEAVTYEQLKRILYTIEESGDGLTQKTPRHILMFDHAIDLLASYDLTTSKSQIVSREIEYIPLLTPQVIVGKKIRGYYFDYSRIYRNKPDGYVFKRARTWQFNNLRPREYK
ncbi:MAG: DUF4919 domain-containing protein [Alistipes sp.]